MASNAQTLGACKGMQMHHLSAPVFAPIAHAFTTGRIELQQKLSVIDTQYASALENRLAIDLTLAYEFFNDACCTTGNIDVGLEAYRHAWPGCLGAPGYAIMSSATLGLALERWVKYHPLTMEGSIIHLAHDPDRLTITALASGVPFFQAPRAILDASAALIIGLIHWLVPDKKPVPLAVELPYPKPASTQRLEQLFGPHLSFGCPHISLTFDKRIAAYALSTASPALEAIHCAHADALMNECLDGSLTAQIRRSLVHDLAHAKTATLEGLALSLGKSKRTLQHALEQEGITFSELYDDCRKVRGQALLTRSNKSLKSIAIAMGFRDTSGFNKACQRWFGESPGQFRNNQKARR